MSTFHYVTYEDRTSWIAEKRRQDSNSWFKMIINIMCQKKFKFRVLLGPDKPWVCPTLSCGSQRELLGRGWCETRGYVFAWCWTWLFTFLPARSLGMAGQPTRRGVPDFWAVVQRRLVWPCVGSAWPVRAVASGLWDGVIMLLLSWEQQGGMLGRTAAGNSGGTEFPLYFKGG